MASIQDVYDLLHDGRRPDGLPQTRDGGVPIAFVVRKFAEIQQAQNAITAAVAQLAAKVAELKANPPAPGTGDPALAGKVAELETKVAEVSERLRVAGDALSG